MVKEPKDFLNFKFKLSDQKKVPPIEPFHNFRASKSVDRRIFL